MPPWSLVAVQRPVQRDQCVRRIGISLDGRSRGAAVASRSADAGPRPCGFPAGRPRTPRPRRLVPPGPGAIVPRVRVCPHRSRSPCDGGRDGMLDGEPWSLTWSPPRSCVTSKDDQKTIDLYVSLVLRYSPIPIYTIYGERSPLRSAAALVARDRSAQCLAVASGRSSGHRVVPTYRNGRNTAVTCHTASANPVPTADRNACNAFIASAASRPASRGAILLQSSSCCSMIAAICF